MDARPARRRRARLGADTNSRPLESVIDVRVEKSFNLTATQKFSVRMNVFNALNANTVLDISRRSGPTFMRPTSILPPRIVEFRFGYRF